MNHPSGHLLLQVVIVRGRAGGGAGGSAEEQVLLLALVLAARLPLDGLMLAAKALFHVLPDQGVLDLLRDMEYWGSEDAVKDMVKDAALVALHDGLLTSSMVLVGRSGSAGSTAAFQEAVIAAVRGPTLRVILRECRRTSCLTKGAFKMLNAYLNTVRKQTHVLEFLEVM